jgi:hypothetical protein
VRIENTRRAKLARLVVALATSHPKRRTQIAAMRRPRSPE